MCCERATGRRVGPNLVGGSISVSLVFGRLGKKLKPQQLPIVYKWFSFWQLGWYYKVTH